MTAQAVEAVFFWAYTKTPFVGVYTFRQGSIFNKDYLQSPETQFPAIDRALGWTGGRVEVDYRWPGGSSRGFWNHSDEPRGRLGWPTADSPLPWRLGDPAQNEAITFAGDPSHQDVNTANAEYDRLEARNERPYILAVKLRGEERVLHCRAVLGNPPPELEHRGVATLPTVLRDALLKITEGSGFLEFAEGRPPRAASLLARVRAALDKDPNVLLVGPPGTGKTVVLEELRAHYEQTEPQLLFDPERWDDAFTAVLPQARETKVVSLVFHPSYSYENFVAGLMPKGGGSAGVELVARPGPLVSLAHWASHPDRAALLIADEFNRGAAAAIFGDTLGLLDADKRDAPGSPGAWIERPFADEKMTVGDEFRARDGSDSVGRRLTLPRSLSLVAAMNSTDRSVAPIDAALRRRFAIIHVGPDYQVLAERLGTSLPAGPFTVPGTWQPDDIRQLALYLLIVLNGRVLDVLGQDFLLGHALLWQVGGSDVETLTSSLVHAFEERVAATLRMTFSDQDEALGAVLGIPPASTDADRVGSWRTPEGPVAAITAQRLVLHELGEWLDSDRQLNALAQVITG